jgi:hypothetical protein
LKFLLFDRTADFSTLIFIFVVKQKSSRILMH